MKKALLYLDTDKIANPFDLLLALDADYDAVIPYASVTEESVEGIIHNVVFARTPEGRRNTVIMVGGGLEESERVFQKLKRLLRPPLQMSAIWDPNGACTTAAAAVAKIEEISGNLRGKSVTVLAGTGPIGQISALLLRNLGASVTITSRRGDKAQKIAHKLSDDVRKLRGLQGGTIEERCDACKDAHVILSTGALGTQLLDAESLGKIKPEIAADVNAVQPYGIEDMKPGMDGEEIGGIKRLGSSAIGDLKNQVERSMLIKALEEPRFYDYNGALALARDLLK
jgi:methylenetetrahydrofolate/methylenetetrahydromethanopterin dehydrogenase (NADP+)